MATNKELDKYAQQKCAATWTRVTKYSYMLWQHLEGQKKNIFQVSGFSIKWHIMHYNWHKLVTKLDTHAWNQGNISH